MMQYRFLVWLELNTEHETKSAKIAKIFAEALNIDGFSQKWLDKYIITITRKEEADEETIEKIIEGIKNALSDTIDICKDFIQIKLMEEMNCLKQIEKG